MLKVNMQSKTQWITPWLVWAKIRSVQTLFAVNKSRVTQRVNAKAKAVTSRGWCFGLLVSAWVGDGEGSLAVEEASAAVAVGLFFYKQC